MWDSLIKSGQGLVKSASGPLEDTISPYCHRNNSFIELTSDFREQRDTDFQFLMDVQKVSFLRTKFFQC